MHSPIRWQRMQDSNRPSLLTAHLLDDQLISCQFVDEHFMSAGEKRSVLRAWVRFLKNGCTWNDFTIALYTHLTLHCSFIAHYNRLGFYEYYFSNPGPQTFRFFDQFDPVKPGISAEIGMASWLNGPTAADLNRAMRETSGPFLAKLRERFRIDIRERDLAQAAALAKAYGFIVVEDHGGAPAGSAQLPPHAPKPETSDAQQALFAD